MLPPPLLPPHTHTLSVQEASLIPGTMPGQPRPVGEACQALQAFILKVAVAGLALTQARLPPYLLIVGDVLHLHLAVVLERVLQVAIQLVNQALEQGEKGGRGGEGETAGTVGRGIRGSNLCSR